MPKGKKNEHEWVYMGWDTERKVEYSYCDLCKTYQATQQKIPKKQYQERVATGKVVFR